MYRTLALLVVCFYFLRNVRSNQSFVLNASTDHFNATEGQDITVSLTVDEPVSNVIWTICCRGLQIVNNTKFILIEEVALISLTIRNIDSEDTGTYTVTVNNGTHTIEQSFTLRVQTLPEFLDHPVSVTVLVEEVVQLICKARGDPIPTITWFTDNGTSVVNSNGLSITNLFGESVSSSVLVFERLNVELAGVYYCIATNFLVTEESVSSNKALVTALYSPDVNVVPSPTLIVNVTDSVVLTCTAFGIPLPNVTWIKTIDGVSADIDRLYEPTIDKSVNNNVVTSLLMFDNITKVDEATYTCFAQNDIRNVLNTPNNASVGVIVQVPPTVTAITLSPVYTIEGKSITLNFNITDADPQVLSSNIAWVLSTTVTSEDITRSSSSHFAFSENYLELMIRHVQLPVHSGIYTLTATNEAGQASASIEVIIERPPSIFKLPEDMEAVEGDDISFDCLAIGDPIPEQMWLFNSLEVIPDYLRITIGEELYGTLAIWNVTYEDRGTYTCIYNSSLGQIEFSAELAIQVSPVFQDITVPVNGTAGSSVSMTCNSTGVPVPSITWLKDGNPISSTPGQSDISFDSFLLSSGIHSITSTLQLMGLVLNDTSNYSCTADNVLARPQNELSDELPLLVLYPPDVSINRDSLTVNQSDLSSFTCEAFGIPLPSFTWFFNGSSISTNNGYVISNSARINGSGLEIQVSTLTILNSIRSIHEGSYTCRASNDIDNLIGTPESVDALLTVQVPPRVQAITEDPVGVVNRTVTLSFLIDQASPVVQVHNIKWQFDDTTVLNNGVQALLANHMFSADVLSLTLTNVQHSDQGVYSVTATNEAGFNSSEIFLEVEAAPVITVSPTDTMQLEGLNVTFECEAVAEPLYTVEWQLNETSLNNSSNKYLVNPITGQLSIYSVVLEDTGMYTCIVDNVHGNDSASATLTVQSVPEFTVNPVGVSVLLIGETVQLNCSSFAVPVSNITWLKDESVLDLSDQSITVVASVQEQVTFSELIISNLDFINTGSYSCMAVNELVSKQYSNSTLSQIIVNMPIVIVESPKDSIVNETDVAEYKCIAEGLPTPSITWSTPDVSDLTSVDFVRVEQSITESMGASRVESTLTFPRIQDTEANTYTCTASNIPRDTTVAVNESFNIIVQTKPVVVFTGNGTVVGVEFREAEMRFNVSRDLPLVLVDDIRWFFKQQGFNTRREIIDDDRYTFSEDRLTLTVRFLNLTDSGTYTVEASNIVGTGSASASLDVQKAPVIIVPLVSLRHLSGTTAAFICEADANPRHTIEWTKNDEQIFNSSRILITGLGTAISTLTITDLQLNDTGSYTCFAENVHGNDSTTNELFVQVPPSFIDNPTSVNLTAGSSVTVLCNVTGFPQPEVDILKDGVTDSSLSYERSNGSLPNGLLFQSVSLLLSDVTFADTALYSCSASNKLASQVTNMSPAALHTVQYAPDVSVSPLSIVANESDSIVLVCQVSALPVPNIVWLNSSSDVSLSAPTESGSVTVTLNQSPSDIPVIVSNLSISGILKIHEANYTCVASNGIENLLGTPENAIVPVIVQVPPTVIAVDSSVLGVVNGSVTLMFIIERASPEVLVDSIRWSFVGSESVTSEDITTPSDSRLIVSMNRLTLTIYNITNEDEGNYTLTASNPAGISTDTITFSVEAAPVFDIVPENLNVLSGRPAVFACNATSEPLYSIRWEREGLVIAQYLSPQDVPDSVNAFARLNSTETGVATVIDDSKYLLEGEGSLYGQLMVLDTVLDDAREYTCYISNVHGNISTSATLLVQVVPVFTSGFRSQTNASVSENVTVNCNAAGQPEPNITWYRDGVELTSEDEGVRIVETAGVREFNSSLRLMSVTRAHQGEYWCNATNFLFERFEATSPRWIFNVYYPPNVIKVPITLQRQAAQYAVFKCQITSFPAPVVQWTRTGSVDPITDRRGKFEIKTTLDDSSITGPYSVETQLVIFNLSFTDQQTYTCAGISQVNVQNFINARSNASASLFVNVPPRVVAITASPSIAEWSNPFTISFDVLNAQPQVTPQNITWRFDPSTNTGLEQIVASDRLVFSSNRRSLEITSVRLSDIGRYILTAINTGGSSTASIAINVLVAPVIENGINASLSVPVDIGNTISFTCRADGIPTPTLIWRRNGTVIATTGRTTVSLVTGPSIRTEIPTMESVISTVTLRDVKESDDYTRWTCTAENSVGINEHYYILRVEENGDPCVPNPCQNGGNCYTQDGFVCVCIDGYTGERCDLRANPNGIIRPRITVPPRPISSQLHSIVNLTCIAEGNPQPNIEWYKDDVVIRDAKAFLYTFELGVNSRGWYTCRAVSNLEGGRSEQAISDPVLVTIDNVAQYLMTSTVSISLLQNIYGSNLNNEQLVNRYIELLGSDFTGEILRNGSVIFSVSLHALIDQKDTYNSTFSAIVTLVTDAPNLQELYSFLLSYEGTPSFVLHDLIRFDGCVSEVSSFSPSVYWPETNLGINSTLECPCGDISLGVGQPRASRRCGGTFATGAEWREPLDSSCVFNSGAQSLCLISSVSDLDAVLFEVAAQSGDISSGTELLISISLLENRLQELMSNLLLLPQFLSVINDIVTVDREILLDAQETGNTSSRILTMLDEVGNAIPTVSGTMVYNQSSFVLSVYNTTNDQIQFNTKYGAFPVNVNTSVGLPSSGSAKYITTVYPDDRLFATAKMFTLGSVVIGIDSNTNGNRSAMMRFGVNQTLVSQDTEPVCVFWDFELAGGRGDWSTLGCERLTSLKEDDNLVTCFCNHFTHFAVVFRPVDSIAAEQTKDSAELFLTGMEAITVIIFVISIVFLVITIVLYLKAWTALDRANAILFINTCSAMIVLYVIYIGAIYAKSNEHTCIVFAALFHYIFLVVVFALMLESGFFFIRRFWEKIERYSSAIAITTWIVPALIVIFCVAPGHDLYSTDNVCRPRGTPFYLGMVIPFIAAMLLSWTLLGIWLLKSRAANMLQWSQIVVVSILFSVGWTFALAVGEVVPLSAATLQILFCMTGGLLGLYIFVLYCIGVPTIRGLLCRKKKEDASDVFTRATSNAQSSMRLVKTMTLSTSTHDSEPPPSGSPMMDEVIVGVVDVNDVADSKETDF